MSKSKKKNSTMKWLITIIIIILIIGNNWSIFTNSISNESTLNEENNQKTIIGLEIPIITKSNQKEQIITYTGHTLSYNSQTRTPLWVAWELTKTETQGKNERNDVFLPDPNVKGEKVETYDYSRSGYDRGHMAPAGDMKWNKQAMQESFYMSNICPQDHNLNKGDWNNLEIKTREWARRYGKVYITCGPIYEQDKPIKYIGNNRIAIPHAFFKTILIYKNNIPMVLGFYFENNAGHQPLKSYLISIDELERRTNMDFFSLLPDDIEEHIEKEVINELP